MKILFIGAVEFSSLALSKLINIGSDLVGVCTLKSSPGNSDFVDLTSIAESANIPVRYTPDINSISVLKWASSLEPDIIFCFGWSRLIKKPLLSLTPLGVIGFHPASLPYNRGRHPIIWALVLGLKNTASTFFIMDEGADTGDIISQELVVIEEKDDARSLYDKIAQTALTQIENFLPKLNSGALVPMPQDPSKGNVWRKRTPADGMIDWRMTNVCINNLVRALTRPYVGAHFILNDVEIKVWRTEIVNLELCNIEPGKVLQTTSEFVLVKTGRGGIKLLDYEPNIEIKTGIYL